MCYTVHKEKSILLLRNSYQYMENGFVNDTGDFAELLNCDNDDEQISSDLLEAVRSKEFKDFVKTSLIPEFFKDLH